MALDEAGIQLIASGVAGYLSDIAKADRATTGFYGTLGNADKSASGFQKVITGALREVGAQLVQFGIQGAKAIGGFVKDSIGLAGDFEAGMNEFRAVAGQDVDTAGLEEFHDLFIQLGKDLPVSTSEVQKAATEMVKGGIDPATVAAGGLRQNIQFAAAAMDGDLVKAAEISSKILGGWAGVNATAADKAAFLTHATDLLAKAANASSTDVEGLSQGIFNAQGIARTAGVSFDDLTTTLAELAPRFASSSEAGNSLKNMIARLQPTTQPATDAMTALGLYTEEAGSAFYDAQGNFVGFQQASQLLQDSLKGLTKEQQAATLQQIFGNDAMGSASALAELGAQGYTNMADALAKANGVQEAAALKQQGYNTALENFKGGVEALQISLGEKLLPVLGNVLNALNDNIGVVLQFADAVTGDAEAFDALSPSMQEWVKIIQDIGGDIQTGVAALQSFAEEIQSLIGDFNDAGGASDQLGGVLDDLNGVWALVLKTVTDVSNGYLAIVQAVLPIVQGFIDEHGTEIAAFFQTSYDKIISIVNLALDLYDAVVPQVLGSVAGFIDEHAAAIQTVLGGAWDVISGLIDGALTLIEGVLKVALDIIHGDWSKAWTDIQEMSARIVLDIGQVIEGFLNIIAGFFDTSLEGIVQTWSDNWAMLVDIAMQTDWMQVGQSIVDGIKKGISDAWGSLSSWVAGKIKSLFDVGQDAQEGGSPAMIWTPVGESIVQGIMLGMTDAWPTLTAMVGGLAGDLVDQMQDLGDQVNSAIADAFGATASVDRQMISNMKAVEGLDPTRQAGVKSQLDEAQKIAQAMNDPAEAAAYFKMRSKQLIELGELNDEINAATDAKQRERLIAQYNLVNAAQQAEMKQFEADQKSKDNTTESVTRQINDIMLALSKLDLTDDQIRMVDRLASYLSALGGLPPGRAGGGPVNAGSPYVVGEQGPELFIPSAAGDIMSALASRQSGLLSPASMMSGATNNHTQTTTLNMPIYTNNSPAAMQQSMAVAMAGLM